MNDKDLKRRLEDELESIAPKMSQRVANAPIGTSSEGGAKRARAPRRKVRFTVAVSAIAAVLVIAIVLAVVVPPLFKTVPEQGEAGYLLMNINPDVEILFDEDGKVTSVKSGNADADVLLADESFRSSLVGESVDTAAAAVAERALEMGYIDGDATSPDAVGLTVVGGDGVAKIGAAVRAAFVDAGAACVVVAKTADRAWLAERFDVAEGELKDMLAEVEKGADAFFERTAQDLADVSALTRIRRVGRGISQRFAAHGGCRGARRTGDVCRVGDGQRGDRVARVRHASGYDRACDGVEHLGRRRLSRRSSRLSYVGGIERGGREGACASQRACQVRLRASKFARSVGARRGDRRVRRPVR